jgi:hypothetical protein
MADNNITSMLALRRIGELRKHIVETPLDDLLAPYLADAIATMFPSFITAEIEARVQSAIDRSNPKPIEYDQLTTEFKTKFVQDVWPAVLAIVRQENSEFLTPQTIASIRKGIIPIGLDDITPSTWPRVVSTYIDIPHPGMQLIDGTWRLCKGPDRTKFAASLVEDSHADSRFAVDSIRVGSVDVSATSDKSIVIGDAMTGAHIDWSFPGFVSLGSEVSGSSKPFVTFSKDANVFGGDVQTHGSILAGSTVAILPSGNENIMRFKGRTSIETCTNDGKGRYRPILIGSDGRVVINPLSGQSEAAGPHAMHVYGGQRCDDILADNVDATVMRCTRLVVGGEDVPDLSTSVGRHFRVSVRGSQVMSELDIMNPFGEHAIAHVSFLGIGSVNIARVGQRSISVRVWSVDGGSLMVSVFPPS